MVIADRIKMYRPISCCSVMYKLLSRVITTKIKCVVGPVVNLAQASFIPGRQLGDNILLTTEIIRGYGIKNLSPRFMIKINKRKAYDSIAWPFLKSMMQNLGFS